MPRRSTKGYTLIEILIVTSIIALLSAMAIVAMNYVKYRSYDVQRMADMNFVRSALILYYDTHGNYPTTNNGNTWNSECTFTGYSNGVAPNLVIPGLIPQYLPSMPADPQMNAAAGTCCYSYRSNGTDYKLLTGYSNCPTASKCTTGEYAEPDPANIGRDCQVSSSAVRTANW